MRRPENDITIDGVSLHDLGWDVFGKVEVSEPVAKELRVDVPGADGTLDLTEALGPVRFEDRTLTADLLYEGDAFEDAATDLRRMVCGHEARIIRGEDVGFTWRGRLAVAETDRGRGWGKARITATLEPYKSGGTLVSTADASSGVVMQLTPGRGQAVPQIRVGAPADIDAGGVQVTLPGAGTWEVDAVTVGAGVTTLRAYSRSGESGNRKISSWSSQTIGAKAAQMLCQAFWTSTSPTEAHAVSVAYEILEL